MRGAELDRDWYQKHIVGHLYAVKFEDGLVKIGYTTNPVQRFEYLEKYYRGRPMRITQEYVGPIVNKCRFYEALALLGLEPCEKREVFNIPFLEAVNRIKRVSVDH